MIRRTLLLAFATAGLAVSSARLHAQTETWTIDPGHSSINFQVKHLTVTTVRGSLTGIKGNVLLDQKNLTKSSVTATFDTATVNTNNEKRDADLKSPKFFDVAKYPTISFKSTGVTSNGGKNQLVGDLTLSGVTKSVTLDLDGPAPPTKGMQGGLVSAFSASGALKRSDFNFGAGYPVAIVADDIKFTIDIEIDKK